MALLAQVFCSLNYEPIHQEIGANIISSDNSIQFSIGVLCEDAGPDKA